MLFYCCLAHPSVMMRASLFSSENMEYMGKLEDYRLWLNLIINRPEVRFANIGIALLRLRKHTGNVSKQSQFEEEVEFKKEVLQGLLKVEINNEVVKEFILITGKKVRSESTIASMKYRKQVDAIFA